MDPDRARIQADLSGVLDGPIRCDDAFLQIYASDASIYEIAPLGVVRPTGVEDVVACVNYARENQLSIIPRGAGSSVNGGAVGRGLVLDFSYGMRRIGSFGRQQVTVEPGVVLRQLNRYLTPHRQHFGPDPATRAVTTLGGVLATNHSGSRWNRYGSPRDKVLQLQIVLASGEVVEVSSAENPDADTVAVSPTVQSLKRRVQTLRQQNAGLIEQHRPDTRINQAGYNVFDLGGQPQDSSAPVDLTRLLVGSEGTLGIITSATLKTEPLPAHRGVALLFFERLSAAAEAALAIEQMNPAACDMVDRRLLSIARETDPLYQKLLPSEAESMLLVEFQTIDEDTLRKKLDTIVSQIQRRQQLAFHSVTTTDPLERDQFWHLVRRIVPLQYRLGGQRRAIPFVEDIAIAPERMPEFLRELHGILNRHEVTASVFAHMPQGQLHIRPLINMADQAELPRLQRLAMELFDRVVEFNGTISGGLGDGLSRTWYLPHQYGRLANVFSGIKDAFDPQNVLNPGKIVNRPAHGLTDDVRPVNVSDSLLRGGDVASDGTPEPTMNGVAPKRRGGAFKRKDTKDAALPVLQMELAWDLDELAAAAQACNGCGSCRTRSPIERMCPMFRLVPKEESSPRAKANLMRGVVTGQLNPRDLATDDFRAIADLCVNCHQCRIDCPASVDVPKLMVEAKAQHFTTNGLTLSDWCLTRLDWLYSVAGRMPRITNRLIRNKVARWLLDRLLGIAQGRKLPPFATTPFSRWAQRRKLDRISTEETTTFDSGDATARGDGSNSKKPKIVYFVDAYANWNDVELAQAFVAVMKHNGVEVVVPRDQAVSGMSLISDGAIKRARKIAQRNIEWLAEWIRLGYQVVTTEPSAALALSHEYLNLLGNDDEDARLVAASTIDATSFLLQRHQAGELNTDFHSIKQTIGYHLPCHQRALMKRANEVPAVQLLRLIPDLQVEVLDKGCSGMAGTYGMKRKNYLTSLRMGLALIDAVREPGIVAGSTECSTCKMQMEQGTTKPTLHPIKILAMAYGLMPDLEDLFSRESEGLVTT